MTFHVVRGDGEPIGEFSEEDFRKMIFSGQLTPNDHYWYEGMEEWKPISAYRVAAKTVRLTAPPPSSPPVASVRAVPPPKAKKAGLTDKIKRMFSK